MCFSVQYSALVEDIRQQQQLPHSNKPAVAAAYCVENNDLGWERKEKLLWYAKNKPQQ